MPRIALVLLYTFFAVVFLISGLILNFLQALAYVALYHTNRNLYRRINYYLIYSSWSQIVAVAEWWSGSSCNLYGDEEALKLFGKEHAIVVMNHKYDIDWLMCWLMCDKLKMLGSAKCSAKKSLSRVPIIGWGWVFAEMIFLERNWEKDSKTLGERLDNLVTYEHPVMLLLFCEGTRFTQEKYEASMEVARAKGLPELKYHLLPRTKGFNFSVRQLKDKTDAIYDVQLAFAPTPTPPTFSNLLRGHKFVGDMYIRRIPMKDIPTDTNEETSAFLFKLYQEKDHIMNEYLKTNKYPGKCIKFQRRPFPLLNSLFWSVVVGLPCLYAFFTMVTSGNTWLILAANSVVIIVLTSIYFMVGATKAKKGSSYGKVTPVNDPKAHGKNGELTSNDFAEAGQGDMQSASNGLPNKLNEQQETKDPCSKVS